VKRDRDRAAVSGPLGAAGLELVRVVGANHPALDAVQHSLLGKAARLADRAEQLAESIRAGGAVAPDRFGVLRPVAAVAEERKTLIALADAVRKIVAMNQAEAPSEGVGADLLD
jgi:hypothetical protein